MSCLYLYIMEVEMESMVGYNDDLVMSLQIGLWIRDTGLRLRNEGIELQNVHLNSITSTQGLYTPKINKMNLGKWKLNKQKEDLIG